VEDWFFYSTIWKIHQMQTLCFVPAITLSADALELIPSDGVQFFLDKAIELHVRFNIRMNVESMQNDGKERKRHLRFSWSCIFS